MVDALRASTTITLATEHIDVVITRVKGEFAIKDFLASSEIFVKILDKYKLNE